MLPGKSVTESSFCACCGSALGYKISTPQEYRILSYNAKNSYIVHYSGLMDTEDGKNQWFRGPTKPLTSSILQHTINEQLKMAGDDGKFKLTVANEGLIWLSDSNYEQISASNNLQDENHPVPPCPKVLQDLK